MLALRPRPRWLAAVTLPALLLTCQEFSTEALLTVTVQQTAAWPDTLTVTEITNLTVQVSDPQGRVLRGVEVVWETSDSTILRISRLAVQAAQTRRDSLAEQQTASVCAHGPGTAELVVSVEQGGFQPAVYRVPIVVSTGDWPAVLAVTESDTVGLKLRNVDPAFNGLSVAWRSTDTGVLKVDGLGGLEAVVTAHARGTTEVIANVERTGSQQVEFRIPISVGPLNIQEAAAWPDTLTTAQIDSVAVTILGYSGAALQGLDVNWSSSNTAVLEVTRSDALSASVTAVGRGSAEIIARVDTAGFEPSEYRSAVQVLQGWKTVRVGGGKQGDGTPCAPCRASEHACGITTGGAVHCWGDGLYGQLGTGAFGSGVQSEIPVPVFTGVSFQDLAAGHWNTCACSGSCSTYTPDQSVFCWGYDREPVPTSQPGSASISVGAYHSCGVETMNIGPTTLQCRGSNAFGQLGQDLDDLVPIEDVGGFFARKYERIKVIAGTFHTCAVVDDGSPGNAYCWGRGTEGQLGDGSEIDQPAPVSVAGGLTFTAISVGGLHTCGLSSGGDAYCWGSNSSGQLGDGTTTDRATPVLVGGGLTFSAISAGGDYPYDEMTRAQQPRGSFTCALTIDDEAYCWGMGGVLGNGTDDQASSLPIPVVGDHRFVSIDAGFWQVCAVTAGQAVYCWGSTPIRLAEPEFRR